MTDSPERVIARLTVLYDETVAALRKDILAFADSGTPPDFAATTRRQLLLPRTTGPFLRRRRARRHFARLRAPRGRRDLRHHHHPPRAVLRLSHRTARTHRAQLRRALRGAPVAPGNALPLRARRGSGRAAGGPSANRDRAPLPEHRPGADRQRTGRRDRAQAGRIDPAFAVRRAAHRLFAGPARALYRHRARGFPAVRAVHQLSPLCRRIRRLGSHAAGARHLFGTVWRGRTLHQPGPRGRPRTAFRHGLAPPPDARLPPDGGRAAPGSRWSISASGRPTPRRSPTIWRCCGRKPG